MGTFLDDANRIAEGLPPLGRKRNPAIAAIIGFCFGGIGLGFYFESFTDFIVPLIILIGMYLIGTYAGLSQSGVIGGALVAAVWGFVRAVSSNEKLAHT